MSRPGDWYTTLADSMLEFDRFALLHKPKRKVDGWHGDVRDYYIRKFKVAQFLRPTSIIEIGVRAGYSAFAFLSASPGARYVGIDNGDPSYNFGPYTAEDYRAHARKLLAPFDAHFITADSQELERFPRVAPLTANGDGPTWGVVFDPFDVVGSEPFDFAHIDGSHTFPGAFHDTQAAILSGIPAILVDDVDYIPEVRAAVQHAARGLSIDWLPDPLRGSALIHNVPAVPPVGVKIGRGVRGEHRP